MSENFLTAEFVPQPSDGFKLVKSFNLFVGAAWRNTGLDPFELAVFMNLASRMDQNHECYPSAQTIADECRMGRTRVFVALRGLKEKGFITWRSGSNGGSNNVYGVLGHPSLKIGEPVRHVNGGCSPRERVPVRHVNALLKVNPVEGEPSKDISPPRFSLESDAATAAKRKKAPAAQSFSEVLSFCLKNQMAEADARYLWCHWEGNGWTNRNKPMRSWKDTAIAWRETHRILPSHTATGGLNGHRRA